MRDETAARMEGTEEELWHGWSKVMKTALAREGCWVFNPRNFSVGAEVDV